MKKRFFLSVLDFALPAPMSGSIDIYSGFQSQQAGVQIHKEIQALRRKQFSTYQSEVWSHQTIKYKKLTFEISGRIDGIYNDDIYTIEEIKTAFDLTKLQHFLKNTVNTHPYWLQLKIYGYFHWLRTKEIPKLQLCLVSQRNRKTLQLSTELNIPEFEKWLQNRLSDLSNEIKNNEKRSKKRKKIAKSISFPFTKMREGQKELIETVDNSLEQKTSLLVQAPTGLGKTIGILYPALKESMKRGQKVIYITPKNSQHRTALDAVRKIQKTSDITSLTITAKKKICLKSQQLCNSEYCEFAENHFSKIEEHQLLNSIQQEQNFTAEIIKKYAITYQVCPYELQMQCIPYADVIICDYHYVFANQTNHRVAQLFLGESEKPNLVIDEIHNLPSRGMEYYSPHISSIELEQIALENQRSHLLFRDEIECLLHDCLTILKQCRKLKINDSHLIKSPYRIFKEQEEKLKIFLAKYLASEVVITDNDLVLAFCNQWTEFTAALECVNEENPEFFIFYSKEIDGIKITCCDASKMLSANYSHFQQIIGFSATIKPFDYYSRLTGLDFAPLNTAEFNSPYPRQNRKIIIIPQISTKYSARKSQCSRIVETIKRMTALKQGNYFIFFPSFEFLEIVYRSFHPVETFSILKQTPGMNENDINYLLSHLSQAGKHFLIFAVQGGILSEGVDYPGDMVIGAFVIGPPLPIYNFEREQMRKYYALHYSAGFDYAYIYPAMAKAIQAAGRVIRSEQDKGLIVLIDNRFLHEKYAQCMPNDWFNKRSDELVSQAILKEVNTFWENAAHQQSELCMIDTEGLS